MMTCYELEANAAAVRAAGHVTALGVALDETANALAMAELDDLRREVVKTRDLLRLLSNRLSTTLRQMADNVR